jgi:hypothetical protein
MVSQIKIFFQKIFRKWNVLPLRKIIGFVKEKLTHKLESQKKLSLG